MPGDPQNPAFVLRTPSECRAENRKNSRRWARNGERFNAYRVAIDECTSEDPCERCYCAYDTGALRYKILKQAPSIFEPSSGGELSFITAYLCRIPMAELAGVRIDRLKHDLRMLLRRCNFDGVAIGSIEAGFQAREQAFLVMRM